MQAILGLGCNLGNRAESLQLAVSHVRELLDDVRCSPIYESPALLPEGAPRAWDQPYLNMAIAGETALTPLQLLGAVKQCELVLGRQKRGHWGPREIDIDILAYGDQVIEQPDLIIPHAGLLLRDFALVPLADVAPGWRYPLRGEYYGMTAQHLAARLNSTLHPTEIKIL